MVASGPSLAAALIFFDPGPGRSLAWLGLASLFCMACEVGTRVPMAASRASLQRLMVMAKRVGVVATLSCSPGVCRTGLCSVAYLVSQAIKSKFFSIFIFI